MNRNELTDAILDTKKAMTFYESIKTDCTTCEHLGAKNKCHLHDSTVPDDFIATGCDQWQYNDAPF